VSNLSVSKTLSSSFAISEGLFEALDFHAAYHAENEYVVQVEFSSYEPEYQDFQTLSEAREYADQLLVGPSDWVTIFHVPGGAGEGERWHLREEVYIRDFSDQDLIDWLWLERSYQQCYERRQVNAFLNGVL